MEYVSKTFPKSKMTFRISFYVLSSVSHFNICTRIVSSWKGNFNEVLSFKLWVEPIKNLGFEKTPENKEKRKYRVYIETE